MKIVNFIKSVIESEIREEVKIEIGALTFIMM